jgi:hypothetical protein
MSWMLAILLFPVGLVLCLIQFFVVVYVLLVRAARPLIQLLTRRVCRTEQGRGTAVKDGLSEVVRSVEMQGLQIEAAGEACHLRLTQYSGDRKATWQSHLQVHVHRQPPHSCMPGPSLNS